MKREQPPPQMVRSNAYKRILRERRAELLANLGAKLDTVASLGRVAEDDQAQLSHDEYVSSSLNMLDYAQLRMIDEALDRLRTGDYGSCLACGDPIPAKRLRALPWARYCVPCQERQGLLPPGDEVYEAESSPAA